MKQNAVGCNSNTRSQCRKLFNNGLKIVSYQRFATCNSDLIDIKLLNENFGNFENFLAVHQLDGWCAFERFIGHTIQTSEIATIGNRESEIIVFSPEGIE